MDTPNVPVDCASCARLREQVATLAHQSAGLREERDDARVELRVESTLAERRKRRALRRERLARWAGVVAADTERRHARVATTAALHAFARLLELIAAYGPLRAAYNDAVRDLARSWRSA